MSLPIFIPSFFFNCYCTIFSFLSIKTFTPISTNKLRDRYSFVLTLSYYYRVYYSKDIFHDASMISRAHWHGCYFSSYKYWTTFVVGSWCSLAYPLASTTRSGYRTAYLDGTAKGWEESCASQEGNFRIERAKGACREMLFTLFICPTSIGRFIIERRYSTAVITYRYHSLPDENDGV